MEYIFITIAVTGFALQFCLTKMYQSRNVSTSMTISAAAEKSFFFTMSLSSVTCLIFLVVKGFRPEFTGFSFFVALLMSSVSVMSGFIGILVLARGKMSIYTLFMMLGGVILPFLAGAVIWKETISFIRIVGLIILTAALFFPVLEKKDVTGTKTTKMFIFLCFCIFFANGFNSIMSKYHQTSLMHVDTASFIFMRDMINAIIGGTLWFIFRRKNKNNEKPPIDSKSIVVNWMIIVSFAAVYGSAQFFHLMAARTLDASLQFPIVTGGTIILATAAGYIFFREKPGKYPSIGIAVASLATLLFLFG